MNDELETLSFSPVDLSFVQDDPEFHVSLGSDIMPRVHATFPKVKKLVISATFNDFSGLRYIFSNMQHLEALRVEFRGVIQDQAPNILASVFLGIPMNVVHYINSFKLIDD